MAEAKRTISFAGARFELVWDQGVRENDLAGCTVTLRRVPTGEVTVLRAADLVPVSPCDRENEREPLDLRVLVEELLDRGFADDWVEAIATFTFRHGLLRTP